MVVDNSEAHAAICQVNILSFDLYFSVLINSYEEMDDWPEPEHRKRQFVNELWKIMVRTFFHNRD